MTNRSLLTSPFVFSKENNFEVLPSPQLSALGLMGPLNLYAAPYTKIIIDNYTPVHFGFYAINSEEPPMEPAQLVLNTYASELGFLYLVNASSVAMKELLSESYSIMKACAVKAQNQYHYLDVEDYMLVWNMCHIAPDQYLIFMGTGELEFSWDLYENMKQKSNIKILASSDCSRPLFPAYNDYSEFSDRWDGKEKDLKILFNSVSSLTRENYFSVIERAHLEKNVDLPNSEAIISKI